METNGSQQNGEGETQSTENSNSATNLLSRLIAERKRLWAIKRACTMTEGSNYNELKKIESQINACTMIIRCIKKDEPSEPDEDIPELDIFPPKMKLRDYVKVKEFEYIRRVLKAVGHDRKAAARLLGISITCLYRKMREAGERRRKYRKYD